jgi:hypothetical protein
VTSGFVRPGRAAEYVLPYNRGISSVKTLFIAPTMKRGEMASQGLGSFSSGKGSG